VRVPGTHGTGSARKLAVVSKAHGLELGRFSTRNNFHSEVLRRNEVFVLTYVDRIILPSENYSTSAKWQFSEKPIESLPLNRLTQSLIFTE
jgi:hypothetical protein